MNHEILLDVRGLHKHFVPSKGLFSSPRIVRAVDGVDLTVRKGETLGLVGESGSGKSTLARLILRLTDPTRGKIFFEGEDWLSVPPRLLQKKRRRMQIVFQDPHASLNPRMKIGEIIGEGLAIHRIARGREREKRVRELMDRVGLASSHRDRYPHEFSGGQLQRVGIARALAVEPAFVVADEPVSSLDVSIQAQILNLLKDLQEETGAAYLFIAHDLRVVEHVSRRVAIMYLGRVVELAPKERIFQEARHPYTRALLASIPRLDPGRKRTSKAIEGDPPDPGEQFVGCRFQSRCPYRQKICEEVDPPLRPVGDEHLAACHFV